MSASELEAYLHEHIPITAAMLLVVQQCDEAGVVLAAPLPPNSNHRGTVFGGSLASLATLAAWAVVHTGLRRENITARVVVQSSQIEYLLPATGEFIATCTAPSERDWMRFTEMVTRKGRGRLKLSVEVTSAGIIAAQLTGSFVGVQYDGDS
ncbi:MAG: YiiD C-terminal domain-containing protein [Armatimonadetes bacterium]|nr:YiiD C-terminal domain-containing protein [Armatimonadota bacterium]